MPCSSGVLTVCWTRFCSALTSASLSGSADGDAPGDTAAPARGLGLAPGTTEGVRTGVGMGVLILRVSVAAAPGTGVASGPNNVEQLVANSEATSPSVNLAQVIAQFLGATGVAQLAQRLGFDLTDPLSRNSELTADFLQRTLASVVQPETQSNDAAFAL